jgi:hypothetical protein
LRAWHGRGERRSPDDGRPPGAPTIETIVTPVKTGVQDIYKILKLLDSGNCLGSDPGFAGMTPKGIFRLLRNQKI